MRSLVDILYLNTYHQHNAVGNFSVRVLCVGFSGFGCCNFVTLFMIMIVSINGYSVFVGLSSFIVSLRNNSINSEAAFPILLPLFTTRTLLVKNT